MTIRLGQELGNYRLIRLLGQGGFAEVYLGEHIYLDTLAAVKVLQVQLSGSTAENFLAEARTVAHLLHPHIVRVLEFDVEENIPFLIMDYAHNGTLRQRYRSGVPLPLTNVVDHVKQVASALQYAHGQKIIHRDIKPENMLLGREDNILLSDFGIALIAQSSRYQGLTDMAGTIAYMAPEQIQSHPRPASDQYALGVVVYEWLSGERPFQGTFSEVAIKHTVVPPPSLREKVPAISPVVERVVMRALEKDPRQRFGSVWDFAMALEEASNSEQPTFLSPRSSTKTPPFLKPSTFSAAPISSDVRPNPVANPSPAAHLSDATEVHDRSRIATENRKESYHVWGIERRQVVAMIIGTFLFGVLIYSVDIAEQTFNILGRPIDSSLFYYFAIANILFCFLRLIPLLSAITYGPWVGLCTAGVGGFLANYFAGRGADWLWTLGGALTGFIAGLVVVKTHGRYNNASSILLAIIFAAIGEAIGLIIPVYGSIWLQHNSLASSMSSYPIELFPTVIFIVMVLPILFVAYNAVVERRIRT